MPIILNVFIKLILAGVMGGLIGYERENSQRPAGFRTHILVCVSAALVMVTSEFLFDKYHSFTTMDPARLGAQVISGIGFLGAGTIIRDGFNVKGLTTAASLWSVACIGLTVGSGFYSGAAFGTIIIFLTLIFLRRFENNTTTIFKRNNVIFIDCQNHMGWLDEIYTVFEKYDVPMKNIEFLNRGTKDFVFVKMLVTFSDNIISASVIDDLKKIDAVEKVYLK